MSTHPDDRCAEAITFPDGGVTPWALDLWISFHTAYL